MKQNFLTRPSKSPSFHCFNLIFMIQCDLWLEKFYYIKIYITSHSNWPRVLLFDLAHKQCNGIIKGWLHYLKSESNTRFFVNNISMSFLSIMSGHDANPIFFLKDSTSRTLANPPPPSSDRFCLTVLKFGRLRCIILLFKWIKWGY